MRILQIAARLCFAASVIVFAISGYIGWDLVHPARQKLYDTPQTAGLQYETVAFSSRSDELKLKGWLIKAPENKQTIIFAHGYGKNRLQDDVPLLPIASSLVHQGFNVLMFDFRNCGESEGSLTTLGQYEVRDLLGAVDFIHQQPELNRKITLFGFSMGASAAIMAAAEEPSVSAVIADSPYADLNVYLEKNLSVWTHLPASPFNRSILLIVPPLTGISVEDISPMRVISALAGRPLLLIHGEADADVPIENSEMLQKMYPASLLKRVPAAKHVKAFSTDEKYYLDEIAAFLEKMN